MKSGRVATLGTARSKDGFGLSVYQSLGGHAFCIVNSPRHDGPIGISVEKLDDHFIANAGDGHGSPVLSRPSLRDPNPTLARLVPFTIAVPRKLDFDSAIGIRPDFLSSFSTHRGHMGPLHPWTRRIRRGAKGNGGVLADDV